ncbi:hypothetical protein GCM10028811_12940 [Uliginosibacterium sediminicola]
MCIECSRYDMALAGSNAPVGLGVCTARKSKPDSPLYSAYFRRSCKRFERATDAALEERNKYIAAHTFTQAGRRRANGER